MSGPETMPPEGPELSPDEALAAEWALGLLEGAARRAAEDRRLSDPAFAALCARWAGRLLPISDEVPPVAPSPGHWARIADAIAAAEAAPPARPARSVPAGRLAVLRWWDSLALWRGAAAAFLALSLALILTRPPTAGPAPPARPAVLLAATLAGEDGGPLLTAALDSGRGEVVLAPVGEETLDGRVPELWLIPADGRPRSLGVIDLGGARRVQVPPTVIALVADGAVLAVSLEPAGGSPTGQPTGPVVATGRLARI